LILKDTNESEQLTQKSYSSLNYKDDNLDFDDDAERTNEQLDDYDESTHTYKAKQTFNPLHKYFDYDDDFNGNENHKPNESCSNELSQYEISHSNSNGSGGGSTRSNSMENEKEVFALRQQAKANRQETIKFDDTSSWLDEQQNQTLSNKACVKYGQSSDGVDAGGQQCVSKLITKLFPSIKEQQEKLKQEQLLKDKDKDKEDLERQLKQLQQLSVANTETNANASLLKQKLTQLEVEIEKFQKKNTELVKLKEKCEAELKLAEAKRKDFDKQKEEEMSKLKEVHDEEMRKLKLEKKIFEQYKQSTKDTLDRKDRDELDRLRRQVEF